jgi:hypothetical protein
MPASAALPRGEARTATYSIESNDRADLSSISAQAGRFAGQASSASELSAATHVQHFRHLILPGLNELGHFQVQESQTARPHPRVPWLTRAKAVADLGWIVRSTLVRSGEIIDCLTRSALPFLSSNEYRHHHGLADHSRRSRSLVG